MYEQDHQLLWSTSSGIFAWQSVVAGNHGISLFHFLPAGTISTSLSGGSRVSLDRSRVYQATPTLFRHFRHFGTLSGEFCTLGIISFWTRLGVGILALLSFTVTTCRLVYQVILLLFQDFLHGLAKLFTGHRHVGNAGLPPSGGIYSCTWVFTIQKPHGNECMSEVHLWIT